MVPSWPSLKWQSADLPLWMKVLLFIRLLRTSLAVRSLWWEASRKTSILMLCSFGKTDAYNSSPNLPLSLQCCSFRFTTMGQTTMKQCTWVWSSKQPASTGASGTGASGGGRGAEIKEKLPRKCQGMQSCGRKGKMGHFSPSPPCYFISLLSFFLFHLLFFTYPFPSPSSPSFLPFLFSPCLCLSLSLLILPTSTNGFLLPATKNQAIICSNTNLSYKLS